MTRYLLLSTLAVAVGCFSDLPDRPEAPDMTALVDAYANPTATFDQAAADELSAALRARLDLAGALDNLTALIDEVLAPSFEEEGGTARRRDPTSSVALEGDGFARIQHICRGWGAERSLDQDVSGHLALTTTFSDDGFDPVIWGEAAQCQLLIGDHQVLLDGQVNLWIGENLSVDHFGDSPILFQLLALLEVDGERWADADFDIEICPTGAADCAPGAIEVKVAVGDDHVIFYLAPGRLEGGFRAANGEWPCTFEGSDAVCTNGDQSISLTGILP